MSPANRIASIGLPIVAIGVLVVFVGAAAWSAAESGTLGFDFLSYDTAVRRFLAGGVLYDQSFNTTGPFGLFYYPPPFVLLAIPLALFDPAVSAWLFTAILVGAFALGVALMPVSARIRWAILLLGGLSWPLVYAIKLGQVGPILLLTFAIGWRWMDKPWRIGAATAVGTAIKLQPALIFGWALLTGRRRAVLAGVFVFAVLALLATLVVGPGSWAEQASLLLRLSQPITTAHNVTPGRLAFEAGFDPVVAWAVQVANWLAVAAVVIFAIGRSSHVASYLAVVVASQLISPILWDHYALMLLLPVAWLVSRGRTWAVLIPLATSAPLIGITPPIAYPIVYWVSILAVTWEGHLERRHLEGPEAASRAVAQPA